MASVRLRVLRAVAKRPPAATILTWDADETTAWLDLVRDHHVRLCAAPAGDELELTPMGVAYLEELELTTKPKPTGGAS